LILLVGDKKVSIPTIKEASINFSFGDLHKGKFATGTFNFLPTSYWLEAEGIKEQILEVRQLLKPIAALALRTKERDFNQLTDEYLKKVEAIGLNHYYLKDYSMALVLKQFPKAYAKKAVMREKEHFQIYLVIRNQHMLDEWTEKYNLK